MSWWRVIAVHAATVLPGAAGRDKKQPGVAQPAEGAAGEEAQVSSKPVEWPMVPPGSKRQRSRLHQTPGSAPPGATPEDLSPHPVAPPPLSPPGNEQQRSAGHAWLHREPHGLHVCRGGACMCTRSDSWQLVS